MAEQEDTQYTHIPEHATPDKEVVTDVDQPNKPVLEEVLEEIRHDIAEHNSFNVIQTPANATPEQKIAAFDDIAIHKGLALYLKKYETMIDTKIKELK